MPGSGSRSGSGVMPGSGSEHVPPRFTVEDLTEGWREARGV